MTIVLFSPALAGEGDGVAMSELDGERGAVAIVSGRMTDEEEEEVRRRTSRAKGARKQGGGEAIAGEPRA